MGSTPVKENELGSFFNKLVSMLVTGVAAPTIEKIAEAEFPPLAFPIVKQIFEHIVEKYAGKFSFTMQDGVIMIVVDAQIAGELHGTLSSLIELNEAHKKGDPNAIQDAIAKAYSSWGNLIHDDGIVTKH